MINRKNAVNAHVKLADLTTLMYSFFIPEYLYLLYIIYTFLFLAQSLQNARVYFFFGALQK